MCFIFDGESHQSCRWRIIILRMIGLSLGERERELEFNFHFYFSLDDLIFFFDSPETGSLVTAGEEENNPIIDTGKRHTCHQCKIPQPHFALHIWSCTIIVIPNPFQT